MPKLKTIKADPALTPVPTYWIKKTPEGEPRSGVLLLLMAHDDDDGRPIMDMGYWSDKTHQFITLDGNAIEENFEVSMYHIVCDEEGDPFPL